MSLQKKSNIKKYNDYFSLVIHICSMSSQCKDLGTSDNELVYNNYQGSSV